MSSKCSVLEVEDVIHASLPVDSFPATTITTKQDKDEDDDNDNENGGGLGVT
jgi:hypothetical protein